MTTERETLRILESWMEGGRTRLPDHVLDAVLDQVPSTRQRRPLRSALRIAHAPRLVPAVVGTLLLAALALGFGVLTAPRPADLGIFEPVAGRIVYGSEYNVDGIEPGIWGLDPASSDPATTVQLTAERATPLAWSKDGTRLLIQKNGQDLFVLDADGSETIVAQQPWWLDGAAISPDGSRVAFGGLTQGDGEHGGLFVVDAESGQAEVLREAHGHLLRFPTFSPDGTQIAFVDTIAANGMKIAFFDGKDDTTHSVWVMNADGTDAHQISRAEGFGPGQVNGLAWSPAGDRIALALALADIAEEGVFTFGPDGSGFTRLAAAAPPPDEIVGNGVYWSPDGSQVAYLAGCDEKAAGSRTGCVVGIVAADGSTRREIGYGLPGPWHPGTRSPSPSPSPSPVTPSQEPRTAGGMWPQTTLDEVRQAQELADTGDPRYKWQTASRGEWQPGQNHPHNDGFFARFLQEELGWEAFRWDEALPHLDSGDVVYIRCAPATNPLYPDGQVDGCAPTLDDVRYETVKVNVAQLVRQGSGGIWVVTEWEMIEPFEQVAPPSDAEIQASLGAFLQARIDGEGAEGFVDVAAIAPFGGERIDQAVPLLYATSRGSPYERSEFEVVRGPEWPSSRMQFEVRLFAENETVVEQLFSLERAETGDLRVRFEFEPTTENGNSVPLEYGFLDGEVTYRAAHPLAPSQEGRGQNRLAIEGLLPNDGAPRQVLLFIADPQPTGPNCGEAPAADAQALARSIQSDADFEANPPVPVTIGGRPALRLDIKLASASGCSIVLDHSIGADRARLFLVDLPGGSARVLVLATVTDEDSFATVVAAAAPIVESIEFHTP